MPLSLDPTQYLTEDARAGRLVGPAWLALIRNLAAHGLL
jgi:hypothetical protein